MTMTIESVNTGEAEEEEEEEEVAGTATPTKCIRLKHWRTWRKPNLIAAAHVCTTRGKCLHAYSLTSFSCLLS